MTYVEKQRFKSQWTKMELEIILWISGNSRHHTSGDPQQLRKGSMFDNQ